jgi:hypothetical protein
METEEDLPRAVPQRRNHQFLSTHGMRSFNRHSFLPTANSDSMRGNGRVIHRLSASGIFPDEDLSGPVPAAHANVTANKAHPNPIASRTNLNATEMGHKDFPFSGME